MPEKKLKKRRNGWEAVEGEAMGGRGERGKGKRRSGSKF